MPHIEVSDETGRTWFVLEGDPAWQAAKIAKTKLLISNPALPGHLIRTGWPDLEIRTVKAEMVNYMEAKKTLPPGTLNGVWEKVKTRFRAWKTQQRVYGWQDETEPSRTSSEEPAALSSGSPKS